MATFTEEFRSFVQELLLVLISISSSSYKHKWHFFEIFEYGGTQLKTERFHLGVLLETFFKCHMYLENVVLLKYLCLNGNIWLQKRLFHSPSASQDTSRQWSCYVT